MIQAFCNNCARPIDEDKIGRIVLDEIVEPEGADPDDEDAKVTRRVLEFRVIAETEEGGDAEEEEVNEHYCARCLAVIAAGYAEAISDEDDDDDNEKDEWNCGEEEESFNPDDEDDGDDGGDDGGDDDATPVDVEVIDEDEVPEE